MARSFSTCGAMFCPSSPLQASRSVAGWLTATKSGQLLLNVDERTPYHKTPIVKDPFSKFIISFSVRLEKNRASQVVDIAMFVLNLALRVLSRYMA